MFAIPRELYSIYITTPICDNTRIFNILKASCNKKKNQNDEMLNTVFKYFKI